MARVQPSYYSEGGGEEGFMSSVKHGVKTFISALFYSLSLVIAC